MGKWCLPNACEQTRLWVDKGAHDVRTSANISAIEFSARGFKDNVLQTLKDTMLDPKYLEIELKVISSANSLPLQE